jgi:hypothetical protein
MQNRSTKALGISLALLLTSGCDTLRSVKSDLQSSKAFDRKVRCETYASKTEQDFKDADRELTGGKSGILYTVERAFYSPKRNSCICILRASSVVKGKTFETIQTFDALTKEDLGFKSYSGDELRSVNADVEERVKSLE